MRLSSKDDDPCDECKMKPDRHLIMCKECGCERCEYSTHMAYLNPPLSTIPDGDYFCPWCVGIQNEEKPPKVREGAVKLLLLAESSDIEKLALHHETNQALRSAVTKGHGTKVKQLLDFGAEVDNRYCDQDMTPLMLATHHNHPGVVSLLLARGAKVDLTKSNADRSNNGATALMLATEIGNLHIIRELLWAGANTEVASPTGWTPIMRASSAGFLGVVKELLKAGADFKRENYDGKTALDLAMNDGVTNAILDFQNGQLDNSIVIVDEDIREVPVTGGQTQGNAGNCVVCLQPRTQKSYLMDCGHLTVCLPCAQEVVAKSARKECPTCKAPVREIRTAFDL